jgi:hypothetical protein
MMQMDSGETTHKQHGSYEGYRGNQSYAQSPYSNIEQETAAPQGSMYDDEFIDSLAQRLSQRMAQGPAGKLQIPGKGKATAQQRMALAIVSVIMVAVFSVAILTSTSASLISLGAVFIMSLAIFLINAVFNTMA